MPDMKRSLIKAVVCILPGLLSAGTITTSNLPANTAIINIDGRADGSAASNAAQSLWFHPFSTGSLLEYTVQPGTYDFRVINPADSAALFPSLTPAQLSTIFTAWSFNAPFVTDYLVFDAAAATDTTQSQLLAGAISPTNAATAAAAYALAKTGGYFNQIIVGNISTGPRVTQFSFSSPETLIFVVPDNILGDNQAGVSVLISPASTSTVPEPGSISLMFAGAGALCLAAKRFRRK